MVTTALRLIAIVCLVSGCAGLKTDRDIARERALAYLAAHPDLPAKTVEAIRSNSIHDGMTVGQVVGAWGRPAVVQKFRDGAVQYWFFGCDWPHFCDVPDLDFPGPDEIYQSRVLFEDGVVVHWQN